ncbi:sulfatase-like hydrolase/transferase [Rufibacter latericius]|uniref:Sulfatase n=1 Tax=Rufibacter latericius TaxID=2487040 RepID=A0A3M9MP49_9BACT|nr:sulfatase-like hydrolase/transferase [Rufibacter latericius]RNI26975.1 sulfatase [Rufibacter latericius]
MKRLLPKRFSFILGLLIIACFCQQSCTSTDEVSPPKLKEAYKTESVIIVVIDGPRFTETLGDSNHTYAPFLTKQFLTEGGIALTNFYNDGVTFTNPGHGTITTGYRQNVENSGKELPKNPSFFQAWRQQTKSPANSAWIIASKGKLEILANSSDSAWHNQYMPSTNCGTNSGSGYRSDLTTFEVAMKVLQTDHPKLMLINFKDPDVGGHTNNWSGYLQGIKRADSLVAELWTYLNKDKAYKDKVTLLVTNDHGRHLDGMADGFVSHGDGCEGCRHITLFAAGPDFKKNATIDTYYRQRDIAATVAELMRIEMVTEGEMMKELFRK